MIYLIVPIIVILAVFLATNKRYKWIYILYKTLPRDLIAGIRFGKFNLTLSKWEKQEKTVAKRFTELVKEHPDKIAFYFEDEKWTYQQMEEFSNKIADYFKQKGYRKGDVVALLLENRPEYVGIWLGLSKIGVVTALINTNLVSDPLTYSISIVNSNAVIYGSEYSNAINGIVDKLKNVQLIEFKTIVDKNLSNAVIDLKKELEGASIESPSDLTNMKPRDKILYIYTSGTTGLPKAAVISNIRYIVVALGTHTMTDIQTNDVFYNPLPLYHSAGGMLGAGQALLFGVTVVLRKKFSASNYWTDCKKYSCTVANYIGEICRYVLAAHKPGTPVDHSVKKILGNGLRAQVWKSFVETFKIQQVYEFYGSTEGNSNLINTDNTIGAVGFVPRYAGILHPVTLIRCNEDTGEPIRNRDGFCDRCEIGEGGILIGKIVPRQTHTEYTGYADENASKKKILRHVFKKGDTYFNSGDILYQDEYGNYYFKDRTGDTFRWKGENVATSEIEAIISKIVDLKESVVYGVEIPGAEGRAGMVAIVDPDKTLNKEQLAKGLKANLPSYAVPIFLRVMDSIPHTSTFKVKKFELQKEGFDVNGIKDELYIYDAKMSTYIPLTSEIYANILSGKLRL